MATLSKGGSFFYVLRDPSVPPRTVVCVLEEDLRALDGQVYCFWHTLTLRREGCDWADMSRQGLPGVCELKFQSHESYQHCGAHNKISGSYPVPSGPHASFGRVKHP